MRFPLRLLSATQSRRKHLGQGLFIPQQDLWWVLHLRVWWELVHLRDVLRDTQIVPEGGHEGRPRRNPFLGGNQLLQPLSESAASGMQATFDRP